jgi:hypothetical protein
MTEPAAVTRSTTARSDDVLFLGEPTSVSTLRVHHHEVVNEPGPVRAAAIDVGRLAPANAAKHGGRTKGGQTLVSGHC